jgi:hypothetical protein
MGKRDEEELWDYERGEKGKGLDKKEGEKREDERWEGRERRGGEEGVCAKIPPTLKPLASSQFT